MKREKRAPVIDRPDRIGSYFRLETGPLTLVTVSGVLYNVGMLAGPWFEGQLAQRLYDVYRGSKTFADMLRLAAAYLAVILFVQAMRCVKRFYVRRFANDTSRNMRRVLYNGLLCRSPEQLGQESVGSLMTKAVADVDACAEGMRKFTTEIFDTGVVLISYLALLFAYDARLALISCAFTPLAYLAAELLKKRVYRANAASKASAGRLNDATLDRIGGTVTYRVSGCEARRDADYEGHLADYEKKAAVASLWESAMQPLYGIISMTGVIFILWLGGKNVAGTGWRAWDIAAFTTFLSCFAKMAVKSSHAAKLFNAVQKAQVSWKRIRPLMQPHREPDRTTDLDFTAPAPLSAERVSFAYPGEKALLHDITFAAQPGQIIGVTGPVAGGKSTLGRVFLCELPYEGSIRLGGRELRSLSEDERRQLIGYLGHQPELMSDTLAENICLGEDGDLDAALRAVCLDGEVAQMPRGRDTPVGSGGLQLSGGQQARTALARLFYRHRALLVLDDPFAAVDAATERQILANLRAQAKDSVVLLISHRLDCFDQLDGVLWLENGRAEFSTHAALLQSQPQYAAFCRAQTGGIDLDEKD